MKKIMLVIFCLVAMVLNVNAQNWSLEAKQNAVRAIKCKLKSPSSFVLTNQYGEKIPVSNIHAEYFGEKVEYDSIVYGKDASVIDSIEYICDKTSGKIIDSLVYTSYKTIGIDSIVYKKRVYFPCYKCVFYYEAQNSFGGMRQDFAVVYITKNEYVSRYLDYDSRRFTDYKIKTKHVSMLVPTPPIKRTKTFVGRTIHGKTTVEVGELQKWNVKSKASKNDDMYYF